MILHDPLVLILLPFALLLIIYSGKRNKPLGFRFSSGELLAGLRGSWKTRLSSRLYFLRMLAAVFIIVALARPQSPVANSKVQTEGIDIILAVDSSTSMLAEDFTVGTKRVSRIDIVKDVVRDFIKARDNDRIGIVTFSGRAYTVCPLTLDHNWLLENVDRIESGMTEDGTAIGLLQP